MDWEKFAGNYGLPGLMIVALIYVMKMWLASTEKVELEKIKVEDKKADAMASALTSLSGRIDAHHTNDLQSHTEMAEGIAGLHGKLDQALGNSTPVHGVQQVNPQGYYSQTGRPKTNPGGR